MQPGDLVGFSSYDWTGFIINIGTYGIPFIDLSHVGIIAEYQGRFVLFESTTLCDQRCVVQGKKVSGAQAHFIADRVTTYHGKVYHYPLTKPLKAWESEALTNYLLADIGKPYDAIGAIRSGGWLFSLIESWFRPQDLNNLFCSEWCASALDHIGRFKTYNSSRWNPNSLVRETVRDRITRKRRRYA